MKRRIQHTNICVRKATVPFNRGKNHMKNVTKEFADGSRPELDRLIRDAESMNNELRISDEQEEFKSYEGLRGNFRYGGYRFFISHPSSTEANIFLSGAVPKLF
jgi:hypothetical protein